VAAGAGSDVAGAAGLSVAMVRLRRVTHRPGPLPAARAVPGAVAFPDATGIRDHDFPRSIGSW
jgi:hypothetical protein